MSYSQVEKQKNITQVNLVSVSLNTVFLSKMAKPLK